MPYLNQNNGDVVNEQQGVYKTRRVRHDHSVFQHVFACDRSPCSWDGKEILNHTCQPKPTREAMVNFWKFK